MPLEERTIVDIREEMALAALEAGATVTEVAIRFGVSRPTVRLWRERYRKEGRSGLEVTLMQRRTVLTGRTLRSRR